MPRPVYMVCAQGASQDTESESFSLFDILGKVEIASIPTPEPGNVLVVLWRPWRVFATWMRTEGDNWDQEYESEFRMLVPPNDTIVSLGSGTFRFDTPKRRPLIRIGVSFNTPPKIEVAGIVTFQNRIRRVGAKKWQAPQEYPLIIEATQETSQSAEPPPATPGVQPNNNGR